MAFVLDTTFIKAGSILFPQFIFFNQTNLKAPWIRTQRKWKFQFLKFYRAFFENKSLDEEEGLLSSPHKQNPLPEVKKTVLPLTLIFFVFEGIDHTNDRKLMACAICKNKNRWKLYNGIKLLAIQTNARVRQHPSFFGINSQVIVFAPMFLYYVFKHRRHVL